MSLQPVGDDGLTQPDLETALAWERERIALWADQGDWQALAAMRDKLGVYKAIVATLSGDVDTALLGAVQDGPLDLGGVRFRRVDDTRKVWDPHGLVRAVCELHDAASPGLVHDLLAVLPGTPAFRVGKPGVDGIRSLGLNPDDYGETVVKGSKLDVKKVDQ